MTLDHLLHLINHIDALSDSDFRAIFNIMLIRGMGRERQTKRPIKSTPSEELNETGNT
jgi:hypothetical protein